MFCCDILTSLDNTLGDVLQMTWPMLFISMVLISSVRIAYLYNKKEELILHKEIILLAFVLYILCLFQVVTSQDINTVTGNNYIPFREIFRYNFGGRLFVKNIIGNVIMFVPYGFFATLYADLKKGKSAFLLVLLASLSIECTQLMIGRIFDVDDILLNVIGGMIGFYFYRSMDKFSSTLPKFFRSKIFLDIISVIMFIVMILYIIWRL